MKTYIFERVVDLSCHVFTNNISRNWLRIGDVLSIFYFLFFRGGGGQFMVRNALPWIIVVGGLEECIPTLYLSCLFSLNTSNIINVDWI